MSRLVLKMYGVAAARGDAEEYWDERWDATGVEADARRRCEWDPLFPLVRRLVDPGRLFLEGGCGPALWARYVHAIGGRACGVDFAPRVVERLRRADPSLDVRVADVTALPFASGEVHVYYSGGVVEHFEDGPERALAEARRVIAADGWLLCSVPELGWLRARVLHRRAGPGPADDTARPSRLVDETRVEATPAGLAFAQYVFSATEFARRLEMAGFVVVQTRTYGLVHGLFEVPGFQAGWERALALYRSARGHARPPGPGRVPGAAPRGEPGLARRALFLEDRTIPVLGRAVAFMADRVATMRMYVARPA